MRGYIGRYVGGSRGIYMVTHEYAVVWLLYISVSANKIEAPIWIRSVGKPFYRLFIGQTIFFDQVLSKPGTY